MTKISNIYGIIEDIKDRRINGSRYYEHTKNGFVKVRQKKLEYNWCGVWVNKPDKVRGRKCIISVYTCSITGIRKATIKYIKD